jgi:hypothetical protein
MNLQEFLKTMAGIGLPILGTVLGGPAGAAVAQLLSGVLGDSWKPNVDLVSVLTSNAEALQKAQEFEAKHGAAIMQMHLSALEKSDANQAEINKIDASSTSLFQKGWRPGAAWICVCGLGYTFLLKPVLPWALTVVGVAGVPLLPAIDMTELFVLLGGLLGLGTMRHIERVKGKA